ncbi:serine protease inhibitor ecotin [Paenalcaligenes hominis]|uniref:serine protease inhibitor ecotin n=1 Tax=Paenalcaligenes hominis TaxID=643674 RepID=UPI0035256651
MLHSTQLHTWLKPLGIVLACFFLNTSNAQEAPPDDAEPSTASVLDAFPAPQSGYTRHVIHLPIGNYENNLKIELLAGKVQETDCNPSHYTGQFEEKILEGWGYNYYELKNVEGPASTKMACPDDKQSLQFVPVQSNGSLLQYNSNLPVVVYLPEGLELRWRTWVATPYNTALTE